MAWCENTWQLLDPEAKSNIFRTDRMSDRWGRGVSILINKSLTSCGVDISRRGRYNDIEILAVHLLSKVSEITLVCVYIAPNLSNKVFSTYIDILCLLSKSSTSVIVGDFNLSKINWEKFTFPKEFKSRELFGLCTDGGLS